ncbi:MAG: hypothetical protein K2L60_04505 [Bacteroides sp.]|nr:hypothetical protein [Bacteroides sp.]
MITPLVIWTCVAIAMLAIVVVRLICAVHRCSHNTHSVFEWGREREEFWVPGDRLMSDYSEYEEYEDFEDL